MAMATTYPIVDTGQTSTYGALDALDTPPAEGARYYGQDAQYDGNQPSYRDNGDGTVSDLVTGLMWQRAPTANVSHADALAGAEAATTGGHTDWRLPTIDELYSLIRFDGETGRTEAESRPYIDAVFDFAYGDTAAGERFIDAQYWSSTEYVGTTMTGNATAFGVNFADGRIKGYPTHDKLGEALYVRGNPDYGVNAFVDNGDGTATDTATGLMWVTVDSGSAMTWEEALAYAEGLTTAGHADWRLPNIKELQSIADYTRAPDPTDSTAAGIGPAIDPVFTLTNIGTASDPQYPYVWSGTTHVEGGHGRNASYVSFGEALGWMQGRDGGYTLMDVHGAGAQRSDPKTGDAADYPHGFGPQGDVIRIENHVLAVRDVDVLPVDIDGGTAAFTVNGQEILAGAAGLDGAELGLTYEIRLEGGADTVIGTHRGDLIAGGAGNDTLTGAAGDDLLRGGDGTDTVAYAGEPAAFRVYLEDGAVSLLDTTGAEGRDMIETVERASFSGGAAEMDLAFSQTDAALLGTVARFYHGMLDRAPDAAGLAYWSAQAAAHGAEAVANGFAGTAEAAPVMGPGLSDAQFVTALYEHVLGRARDAEGAAWWEDQLASGVSRGAAVMAFADSAEHVALTTTDDGLWLV